MVYEMKASLLAWGWGRRQEAVCSVLFGRKAIRGRMRF
jgi:hypothetical protein